LSLAGRAAWAALIILLFSSALPAEEFHIYFKTSPPLEQLRPWGETATLSLLVTGADGRPVQEGWLLISLDAPAPGRLLSTDFPLVEGSRLSELRLPLRRGKAEWKYLFPIRGEYRIQVDYVTAAGKQGSKNFAFHVREKRLKWITLSVFMAALFGLGFVAGRIFSAGRSTRPRSSASIVVWLMCVLPLAASAAEPKVEPGKYGANLEIGPARVGQPTRVRWQLVAGEGLPKPAAALTLTITHLEKKETVFSVEKIPVADEFSMNFHFTDGAQYKISTVADFGGSTPVRNEQVVSVTAVEPPTRAMVPALALFLAVVAAGVMAGRWSKRR